MNYQLLQINPWTSEWERANHNPAGKALCTVWANRVQGRTKIMPRHKVDAFLKGQATERGAILDSHHDYIAHQADRWSEQCGDLVDRRAV